MKDLALTMPADPSARINYLFTLAVCENYQIPTLPDVSVQDLISQRVFSWYHEILAVRSRDEVSWYSNYE